MNPADFIRETFAPRSSKARVIHVSGFGRASRRRMMFGIPAGKTYIDAGRKNRKARQRREREERRLAGTKAANRARSQQENRRDALRRKAADLIAREVVKKVLEDLPTVGRIVAAVGHGRPVRPQAAA